MWHPSCLVLYLLHGVSGEVHGSAVRTVYSHVFLNSSAIKNVVIVSYLKSYLTSFEE